MSLDPITAALDLGGKLIERIFPDPTQRDAAKLQLLTMQQNGELAKLTAETDLVKGQIEVNKAEAGNASLLVSGWRPAIGWICGMALGYQFLGRPMLAWISPLFELTVPPQLDMGDLLTLLLGMLGLGGLRTVEKVQGVASK